MQMIEMDAGVEAELVEGGVSWRLTLVLEAVDVDFVAHVAGLAAGFVFLHMTYVVHWIEKKEL